jgi:hypothetical protein
MNFASLTLSVLASAALTAYRAVTVVGAIPAAGAAIAGFARTSGAMGDLVPVDCGGTVLAEAGAAIAVGAAVEVDAQGRVITLASGTKVGRMAPGQVAATAAGQIVELIYIAA